MMFQCDCHTCVVTNTVIEADKVAACLSGWTRCQHDVNISQIKGEFSFIKTLFYLFVHRCLFPARLLVSLLLSLDWTCFYIFGVFNIITSDKQTDQTLKRCDEVSFSSSMNQFPSDQIL